MRKIIELDEFFATGEPTAQVILPWNGGRSVDTSRVSKYASVALDYIKSVAPEPGKTALLLNALGAEETYGPNRNGDGFPEFPVPARGKVASADRRWFVPPGEELTKHYASFETNPAHTFLHHANRDPSKASGVVKKAFWNPRMHRVELLVSIDDAKDPEWVKRAQDGEFIPVSMGCRIKRDVCARCGNEAPTRADYCFPPNTKITMADGTRRAIENIVAGDRVVDASGKVTTVTRLMRRDVDECLIEIRNTIAGTVLRATANHPVFSTPREEFSCYYRTTSPEARSCFPGAFEHCKTCRRREPEPREVAAGELRIDDSVYAPALPSQNVRTLTEEEAYIVGLFVAEGSFAKVNGERVNAQFSLHEDETDLIERVRAFAARFDRDVKVYSRDDSKSVSVRIHSKDAANFFFAHAGEYAHTKRASQAIVDSPNEVVVAYMRGLWDGDGYISTKKSTARLNTASEDLAWQTAALLRRLGYSSYVSTAMVPGGPSNRTNKFTQWYCVTDWGCPTRRTASSIVGVHQIGHVKELRHVPYKGLVYNFETESHSYVAEGLAVHNCDHVKFAMNVVDASGFKDYVHNPSPDFFDISRVFRPADRIGYTLKKVAESIPEVRLSAALGEEADALASKAAAAQKLSDIDKVIQGEPIAASRLAPDEQSFIVKLKEHLAPKLARAPLIDVAGLRAWPLGEVLAAASASGVMLKDAEFTQLALSKFSGLDVRPSPAFCAKVAGAARAALDLFADRPDLLAEVVDSGVLESSKIAAELMDFFGRARQKRAGTGEQLYRRLVPEGIGVRPDAAPTTDVLHVGPYETTRGAAIDAHDAVTRSHLTRQMLGGGALALGGYKMLGAFPALRKFRLPLAAGAGLYGASKIGPPGHQMRTDEGYSIPDITELSAKTASQASVIHLIECANPLGPRIKIAVSGDDKLGDVATALGSAIARP